MTISATIVIFNILKLTEDPHICENTFRILSIGHVSLQVSLFRKAIKPLIEPQDVHDELLFAHSLHIEEH